MTKPKLILDVDGTILNSGEAICDIYAETTMKVVNFEDCKRYDFTDIIPEMTKEQLKAWFETDYFFDNVQMFDNAKYYIDKLSEVFDIYICTLGSPKNLSKKAKYFKKHFPYIKQILLTTNVDKSIIDMSNAIYVDDVKYNLDITNAKYKILYSQDGLLNKNWNIGWEGMVATNWKDLYHMIIKLKEVEDEII